MEEEPSEVGSLEARRLEAGAVESLDEVEPVLRLGRRAVSTLAPGSGLMAVFSVAPVAVFPVSPVAVFPPVGATVVPPVAAFPVSPVTVFPLVGAPLVPPVAVFPVSPAGVPVVPPVVEAEATPALGFRPGIIDKDTLSEEEPVVGKKLEAMISLLGLVSAVGRPLRVVE